MAGVKNAVRYLNSGPLRPVLRVRKVKVALVDALGNLVRFILTPYQRNDIMGVAPRIDGLAFDALLADKAFDADRLCPDIAKRGAQGVILRRKHRKIHIGHDGEIHKWRHLIENDFAKIKEFRGIATRCDKTGFCFRANINLAAALIDCWSMSTGIRYCQKIQARHV